MSPPGGTRPARKVPSFGFNSIITATPLNHPQTHINNTCARLNRYSRIPDAGDDLQSLFCMIWHEHNIAFGRFRSEMSKE